MFLIPGKLARATATALLVLPGIATAQTPPPAPADGAAITTLSNAPKPPPVSGPLPPLNSAPMLQDVTITARHRAERAQSVPVSLTTVDQRQIQSLNTLNLNTIKQLVPTLTINAYNPRNIGLDIRGLGSVGFFGYDGLEGGVGIYLDGVLLGRSTESNFDLPDLQDIEVLRGPQGTLFGKNTVAGAVNITTRLPSFKPQADITASYGNYNYWQLQGYASSAIGNSDKAAVSLSFHAEQHDGYIKNYSNCSTYNNQDDKGVRAHVLLQPTDALTIRIIVNYDHSDANCCITTPLGIVTSFQNGQAYQSGKRISAPERYATAGYNLPAVNPFNRTTDINSWNHYAMETAGVTALVDYDLDGYTISSITGVSAYNWYPHLDGDGNGASLETAANNTTHQRQFSQEFRLTSPLGGPVDFTSGLYFFYQQLNDQARLQYGSQAAATMLNLNDTAIGANLAKYEEYQAALSGFGYAATDIPEVYSGAVYGQGTWHISPKLDFTGGARFTYEDKTGTYTAFQQGGINLADSGLTPAAQAAAEALRTSTVSYPIGYPGYHVQHSDMLPGGLATLSYKPQPNILTYFTYSHAEKSAGINFLSGLPNSSGAIVPLIVAPEKLDNWEAGAKTTLLNGRLLLDGDAFWDEDTNFQSTIFGLVGNTLTAYLASVPKVRSRGVETDIHAQITNNLSLYSSAVFDEAVNQSNPSAACSIEQSNVSTSCKLTGRPIAGASKWNGVIGGEYDYPLPQMGRFLTEAYFGGDMELRSSFYSTADDSAYSKVPGYALGNLNFGVRQINGRWDLQGWIHNFTNARYYLFKEVTNTFPTYNLVIGEVGDPLTFGITLRAKFE